MSVDRKDAAGAEPGQVKPSVDTKRLVVSGSKRPKDLPGMTWRPIHGDPYRKKVVTGWGAVSIVPLNQETEVLAPVHPKTDAEATIEQIRLPEPNGGATS